MDKKTPLRLLLVGCGNMGRAMLPRWQKNRAYKITIVDPSYETNDSNIHLLRAAKDLHETRYDIVIFAVKPQLFPEVLPAYRHALSEKGFVLSIAAGVSLKDIQERLGSGGQPLNASNISATPVAHAIPVVRVMPNLATIVGCSVSGMVASQEILPIQKIEAEKLFRLLGDVIWADNEDRLDRLTAISGSGPGYVFYFIESYIEAAKSLGFSEEEARVMVLGTIKGTLLTALDSSCSPRQLREAVTSKEGVTQAGLACLMEGDKLEITLKETVQAAYKRAVALRNKS